LAQASRVVVLKCIKTQSLKKCGNIQFYDSGILGYPAAEMYGPRRCESSEAMQQVPEI